MRKLCLLFVLALAFAASACGGGAGGTNLCDGDNPPAECSIECDPAVLPTTCPAGFHCTADNHCGQECTPGSQCSNGRQCTSDGRCQTVPACVGLECFQVDCQGGGTTSVSGTVYAPNGTLPLSGITVYVPNGPVEPFPDQLACDRCSTVLSAPLVQTTTDTAGHFVLPDMPATDNVPLVIQVGRWRRQITLPTVPQCTDTALGAAETRLPRNQSEGDIPRMAVTTGNADALECLLRKIGVDDAEFSLPTGNGRIHLFAGNGTDQFDAAHGNMAFPNATTLWGDVSSLSQYDVVFLSCEGGQRLSTKPETARQAVKDYADLGGRVFASHWHNVWLDSAPQPWPMTITRVNHNDLGSVTADVDTSFDRGSELAQWLVNVGASTVLGKIPLTAAKHTVSMIAPTLADRWIYVNGDSDGPSVQYLSFTTPLEQPKDQRCGRVVFSDIHVAADDSGASLSYPSGGCTTPVTSLTPQEKVLLFMIFDIASCIPDIIGGPAAE